jgi:hypothetical protein
MIHLNQIKIQKRGEETNKLQIKKLVNNLNNFKQITNNLHELQKKHDFFT